MNKELKNKLLPLSLMVFVIVLDQVSKILIVHNIEQGYIGAQFLGDFFRIIHVRNPGVAFSFGADWPDLIRRIAFAIIPIIVLGIVLFIYWRSNDFSQIQRWCLCGITGGGVGNIIDRLFRPAGVVDFLDVKFYGLFGMERWPTFNFADSAVIICGILLFISFVISIIKEFKNSSNNKKEEKENE